MPGIVVCHPHPLFGGNMDSPLVFGICRELAQHGIASMRFNFRASGADAPGMVASATREAAVAFDVIRQWDFVNPNRCAIAGHSFGAAAVLRALPDLSAAKAFVLIAPPLSAVRESEIAGNTRPKLFVVGNRDKLVDAAELQSAVAGIAGPVRLDVLDGADHNLTGHADDVAALTALFLAELLR